MWVVVWKAQCFLPYTLPYGYIWTFDEKICKEKKNG